MLKPERQDAVVKEVLRRGTVSVVDLATSLDVSQTTIRRDLDELTQPGYVQRIRGGARRPRPRGPEPPVVQRQLDQVREKQAIGLAAVELLCDGDVIAFESGSTVLELARAIARRAWQDLQVVTNSFTILNELIRTPGVQLVFVGGFVNPDEMGTFGTLAEDTLKRLNINKLFVGCRGIDPSIGLSNDIQAEMEMVTVRAFVAASSQTVVMADHTKFGHAFPLQMLPITDVDMIVTDSLTPENMLKEFQQHTQVIVAPLDSAYLSSIETS